MVNKIKTALIASGGGTDANSIMEALKAGFIPNIDLRVLISTKARAGCLRKATKLGIKTHVIDSKQAGSFNYFNLALLTYLQKEKIKLVFLVGCIVRINPIDGINIYNIHPADPNAFGGNGMYGLEVHRRVISNVVDLIKRGKKKKEDRFFTHPTVHEVVFDYDSGQPLLRADVEIPRSIIRKHIAGDIDLDKAATQLQKHVLPYEWAILPTAVKIAAQKILDRSY